MSAPNTDVKKQERRHKVPLSGMAWMVGFAAVLLVALVIYLSVGGNEPGDGEAVGASDGGVPAAEQSEEATQ
ncbi:hypothetical protein LX81_02081 [Palleronia aestuarii]|uniref:Uncharacterized protein n=1 Tax=Palleronia aestuarii TaxID=568105 RepID=A0A2W7N876_9RHOB|nr:hypothetical protein [Palleronia aestuarii]PZX16230.1 hypothetical protein LX81_02081 [Palleronia aestuarii]